MVVRFTFTVERTSLYWNPQNGNISALPRHVEIKNTLVRNICKDLGVPEP